MRQAGTPGDFGDAAPPTCLPAVLSPEVGHPKGSALHGQCINGALWFTGVGVHTSAPVNPVRAALCASCVRAFGVGATSPETLTVLARRVGDDVVDVEAEPVALVLALFLLLDYRTPVGAVSSPVRALYMGARRWRDGGSSARCLWLSSQPQAPTRPLSNPYCSVTHREVDGRIASVVRWVGRSRCGRGRSTARICGGV